VTDSRLAAVNLEVAYTTSAADRRVGAADLEVAYTSSVVASRVGAVSLEVATGLVFGATTSKRGWGILR
jgi:hypothetical protein